jgi:hypothetical protein
MRLHSKIALDPLFLFFILLSAGTLLILGPLNRPAARPTPHHVAAQPPIVRALAERRVEPAASPTLRALEPDPRLFTTDFQTLQITLGELRSELKKTTDEANAAQARVDAARAELRALDTQAASLRNSNTAASEPSETQHLESLITRRRQEADQLGKDLERETAPAPEQGKENAVLALAKQPVNKLPQPVELLENRITPVTKQYFRFPLLSLKPQFTVKRIRMGETIAEAQRPDSEFAAFLSSIRPNSVYISCLLNRDSFQAFYAVREMAAKKGIEVGWEPAETSGGSISMLGVKLASPSDTKRVAVPDVISPHRDHP